MSDWPRVVLPRTMLTTSWTTMLVHPQPATKPFHWETVVAD